MRKKFLSLLIAAVMVLAMVPATAWADTTVTTENDLTSAISSSDTITLGDNIALDNAITIEAGNDIILDLNNYTISRGASNTATYLITVEEGAKLTIMDSGTDGKLNGGDTNTSGQNGIKVEGELVIESGTISGYYGILADTENAILTVNGGTVYGYYAIRVTNGANATIEDGTITGDICGIMLRNPSPSTNTTKLIINGGTITSSYFGISTNGQDSNNEIIINGGIINGDYGMYLPAVDSTTTINGGTITGSTTGIEIRAGSLLLLVAL